MVRGPWRRMGSSLTAVCRWHRSRWGTARSAHVHPLLCSGQPCRSWRQDWHLQWGQRPSAPLPSPQHPTPALLYLAPAAADTAPHRWHRPRCSSVPARWHRAAHPGGRCQGGSAVRPHHRTRASHTRPAAPDTCVQHGAAVGGHGQINGVSGGLAHHRERLVCPCHGCPSPHTWQSWQQVSSVAHMAPGISWQELLLQQGSVHSCGRGVAVRGCHQHPALGAGNHPASPRHAWAEPWRKGVPSGL